ncbi:MAG: molybdopterin cofactor-binding domain-containing protein, partial [Candidatus Puniceispirillum sp.]
MANGFLRGIGVANPIEIAGGPGKKPHSEFARVTVYPTGMATLVSGSSDSGQGHLTTLRQILHSQLGVAPEDIELVAGDTRSAPTGTGTFGSRTVAAAGTSVFRCAESLINRMLPDAAHLL